MSRLILACALTSVVALQAVMADEQDTNAIKRAPNLLPGYPDFTRPLVWSDFRYEIMSLALLSLYILSWWLGSQANASKAKQWTSSYMAYLEGQFSAIGNKADKKVLVKDSPSDYLLYVSGRRNIRFGHWWIKLKPRSDVFTLIITEIAALAGYGKATRDHVEVTTSLERNVCTPFVFAILPKETARETRESRFDLKTFTRVSQTSLLPAHLTVYSESQKLTETILSNKVAQLINDAPAFQSLIISSMPSFEPEKFDGDDQLKIYLEFGLSDGKSEVQLACELPDILSQLQFSAEITNKLRKNREEVEKEYAKRAAADRADQLAKKKAEAKKAEEERIKKLSPSEQRKWEEKERARELKKSLKKKAKRV